MHRCRQISELSMIRCTEERYNRPAIPALHGDIRLRKTMGDRRANICTRPMQPADMEFLYGVYASTRAAELAATAWSDAEKELFLRQQFTAQHTYYQQHYSDASYAIVMADEKPIGRLYVDRRDEEIRIIDIALLPQHCGRGIGSGLLQNIMDEAARAETAVTIHVEKFNPALRLYRRLGFTVVEDKGVYLLMQYLEGQSVNGDVRHK